MPKLVQDEAGDYFVDTGGGVYQPVSEDQARTFLGGQGAAAGAFQAAGQGLENLITGAGSLLSDAPYWEQANQAGRAQSEALNLANPVTSAAAQFAPQALAGAATGSAGLWPTIGVESALGAATTPESPVEGAVVGAAGGALPFAIAPAARAVGRTAGAVMDRFGRAPQVLDDIAPGGLRPGDLPEPTPAMAEQAAAGAAPAPSVNAPGGVVAPAAPRMADRVTAAMSEADQSPVHVLSGKMTAEELEKGYGVPLTQGDRALLGATTQGQLSQAFRQLEEEAFMADKPFVGNTIKNTRTQQKQAATNYLARELGVGHGYNLTDGVVSDVFDTVGKQIDSIEQSMPGTALDDELRTAMNDVLEHATGSHKGQLKELVEEIHAKAAQNGGTLSGPDWGLMRTKLGKVVDAGQRQGDFDKLSDAQTLLGTLTDRMEFNLPSEVQAELRKLRKQYAIAAVLDKQGARDADGLVNPASFYAKWKAPQSKKYKGRDDVGRFMDTMVTLGKQRVPNSGTPSRLLYNAATMGADLMPGGAVLRRLTGL